VRLNSTVGGKGTVTTYQPNGKELVDLNASDSGGAIDIYNKTGEDIVELGAGGYEKLCVNGHNSRSSTYEEKTYGHPS